MAMKVRRVVTGHDRNGRAIVVSDGPAPIHTNPLRPGQIAHEIWKTGAMPVPLGRDEPDPVAGSARSTRPRRAPFSASRKFRRSPTRSAT